MKLCRTYFSSKYEICMYVLLFISAVLPAILAVKNIRISPDSMIYALISQEIHAGNGIRLPIIYDLHDNYVFTGGAVPYLAQPPLLPILFALLGSVTSQSFLAAQIINVVSHVAIAIFTFLLMKKLYNNSGIALLIGVLVAVSVPLLWDTHHMLSESLFIALTSASIYFLVLSRHSKSDRSGRALFIASICASAAILTRFPGIALIPVFFWESFILLKNKNCKSKCISVLLAAMLPLLTVGTLFIRNYLVSGTVVGWNPNAPERSYLTAFTGTIKMLFLQFNLTGRIVTLSAIGSALFILCVIVIPFTRRELARYLKAGFDLVIIFIIAYTAQISLAMAKVQPLFEWRYMSPLVPFLFVSFIVMAAVMWEMIRFKGFSKLSLYAMTLSLGIITLGNLYKTYTYSGELFSEDVGHYRMLNSPTYNWLKENYGNDVVITTNRPFHLSFFGGYSTIRLPHKRYYNNYQLPDDMELFLPDRMSHLGSRVLALFEKADKQYEGKYIAHLFDTRGDDSNFVLMQSLPDGVVYKLRE